MVFELKVVEVFKLSTGATAFVGIMSPNDQPIITPNDYQVEIVNAKGERFKLSNIGEDIFVRTDQTVVNKFRSLQTFDDVQKFLTNEDSKSIKIVGMKRS